MTLQNALQFLKNKTARQIATLLDFKLEQRLARLYKRV